MRRRQAYAPSKMRSARTQSSSQLNEPNIKRSASDQALPQHAQRSAASLTDTELVGLLLDAPAQTGDTTALAHHLLGRANRLEWVLDWAGEFLREGLITQDQSMNLAAAFELGRRTLCLAPIHAPLHSHQNVCEWAQGRISHLEHEEVWLLSLDTHNHLRRSERIAQGGASGCCFKARDVLRAAVRAGASSIVLVHNHPSGDPQPSPHDVETTRALAIACDVVGVPLLDHVVVAQDRSCSIATDFDV